MGMGQSLTMVGASTSLRRATLRLAIVYGVAVFIAASILWGVAGTDPIESAIGKVSTLLINAVIATGMTLVLLRLKRWSLASKALLAFTMSFAAAPLYAAINLLVYKICMYPEYVTLDWPTTATVMIEGLWLYFGWSALFLALEYSFQVRESERRLAIAREEALAAQMRALRYQVNPHFLFNTLNSMVGLIEEGATTSARDMVLSLSSFLRSTLELDPMQDVRLADEIELQSGYLDIERKRFDDRMRVRISVPDDVRDALVPSLILQPLVENAVKHGVGRTPGAVEILIQARQAHGDLNIVVENDIASGSSGDQQVEGLGIGLQNVANRISARFHDAAQCIGEQVGPRRFRVTISMPLRFA